MKCSKCGREIKKNEGRYTTLDSAVYIDCHKLNEI